VNIAAPRLVSRIVLVVILAAAGFTTRSAASISWSGQRNIVLGLGPDDNTTFFDLNGDGVDDLGFRNYNGTMSLVPVPGNAATATSQGGYDRYRPVAAGTMVSQLLDAPLLWMNDEDYLVSYMMHDPTGEVVGIGPWRGVTNGALGVSFQADGETHYGWIRMSDVSETTFVVHDWAYETQPDVGIVAHATSDLAFVGIAQAQDASVSLSLEGPPMQIVLMECSGDLVAWAPLKWYEDEQGNMAVELYQIDAQGHLHVEDSEAVGQKQRFYRAVLLP